METVRQDHRHAQPRRSDRPEQLLEMEREWSGSLCWMPHKRVTRDARLPRRGRPYLRQLRVGIDEPVQRHAMPLIEAPLHQSVPACGAHAQHLDHQEQLVDLPPLACPRMLFRYDEDIRLDETLRAPRDV